MQEEIHPSELNLFQQHRYAVKLAKQTSRLKNKDWYRDALELEVQVHCFIGDNGGASCFLHIVSTGLYEAIGKLNASQLDKYEELEKFIHHVLSLPPVKGAKSLGIIIHLADEMSLATLSPDYQNPEEIDDLRALMTSSPKEALGDKTVSTETHAWRLFPYQGAPDGSEFATAVAVSRKYENALKTVREIGETLNLPIRTAGLCAPLCAMASQPLFSATKDIGTITVVNYRKFTLLGFYDKAFELMLIRYMPHSNGASAPANIGPAVMATSTALELEKPLIQLLPMCNQDMEQAIVGLQSSMMGSEIVLVDATEIMKSNNIPENIPLEMLVSTQNFDAESYALAGNKTFSSYQTDKWHSQDFLSPSQEELEMRPMAKDMKLLKLGSRLKLLAAFLLVCFLGYSGLNIWKKTKDPAWAYKPDGTSATAAVLAKQMQDYNQWENLLKNRSKGWVSMELISRMVPDDGSIVLSNVSHSVNLVGGSRTAQKLGFNKVWQISGFMNDKGLIYMTSLDGGDGITKLFDEVAHATGNSAYLTNVEGRDLTSNLKQQRNNNSNFVSKVQPGSMLKYSFTLTITQTFSDKDEMAITVIKNLPLAIMAVIAAAVMFYSASVSKKLNANKIKYKKAQAERKNVAKLEKEVGQSVDHLKQWEENLNKENRGTFLEHWKTAEKKFSNKEFNRFPHNWSRIESTLPQMQLDSLSMSPDTGGKLNFKTIYTVWTKN